MVRVGLQMMPVLESAGAEMLFLYRHLADAKSKLLLRAASSVNMFLYCLFLLTAWQLSLPNTVQRRPLEVPVAAA